MLISERLNLALVRWQGDYHGIDALWLRWATCEGILLPTPQEHAMEAQRQAFEAEKQASEAQKQASEAQKQASEAQKQASEALQKASELEILLKRYQERFGNLD